MKTKSQRQLRKQLLRHVEESIDFTRMNYAQRVAPQRHRAILIGIATASTLYGIGFALGYFAWQHGTTDYETYSKFVWIWMIPASVVGTFAYLLSANRRQFAVAKDMLAHIHAVEGTRGWLWRYGPILEDLQLGETAGALVKASRAGSWEHVEPEDYGRVVLAFREALLTGAGPSIGEEAVKSWEDNLSS